MSRGQSEELIPMIDALLARHDLEYAALCALLTTAGPGTFTGLRIGLAAALSFGLALDIPVYGLSSLRLLAWQAIEHSDVPDDILVLIDSKRQDYFAQSFDSSGTPQSAPAIIGLQAIGDIVQERTPYIVVDSASALKEALAGTGAAQGPDPAKVFEARPDTRLMAAKFFDPRSCEAFEENPQPLYLREADTSLPKNKARAIIQ